jgi:hypothetical protein
MIFLLSVITWAFCNQAISTLAFAPHGMTGLKTVNPTFVRNHDLVHAMIADGKDTQTINLGLKPDGKVRLLEVLCTFIT